MAETDAVLQLNQILLSARSTPLETANADAFYRYLTLLERWNVRTNLTSIRDRDSILKLHFAESILCARALPQGITTLLDFGSGAGFPGVPIALMRPEIQVTLAESQNKKAAFLREASRTLGLACRVHPSRAEDLTETFSCVTMRSVDDMERAVSAAVPLLAKYGSLAILTTNPAAEGIRQVASSTAVALGNRMDWEPIAALLPGTERGLLLGRLMPGGELFHVEQLV